MGAGAWFLGHPWHRRVHFRREQRRYVLDGGKSLKGLTSQIERWFVPSGASHLTYQDSQGSRVDPRCLSRGAEHGKTVDFQLQSYVKHGRFPMRRVDPCALRIVKYLGHKGWRPFATQLVVFDEALQYATAIDLLCEDGRGCLVVVEVKTTRHLAVYRRTVDGLTFRNVLQDVPYSQHVQHQLQAFLPSLTLQRQYGVRRVFSVVLLVSPPDRLDMFPTPDWLQRRAGVVYDSLRAH